MTEKTEQQVWIIPGNPEDMAPLPLLLREPNQVLFYDRKSQQFSLDTSENLAFALTGCLSFPDFESCRAAMIAERSADLEKLNRHCRQLAQSIEHIKTIPAATFPNVSREVREQGQQQKEAKAQEKAEAEEVKPALELKKKPTRGS
jgi:hypothetical protein